MNTDETFRRLFVDRQGEQVGVRFAAMPETIMATVNAVRHDYVELRALFGQYAAGSLKTIKVPFSAIMWVE